MTSTTAIKVRELNDAFRTTGPAAGDWMITCGIQAKGPLFALLVTKAVMTYSDFSEGNDPYGEHDFGSINLAGENLFWKIDYYDRSLESGSPDPANPTVTRRVLTVMLASEY